MEVSHLGSVNKKRFVRNNRWHSNLHIRECNRIYKEE